MEHIKKFWFSLLEILGLYFPEQPVKKVVTKEVVQEVATPVVEEPKKPARKTKKIVAKKTKKSNKKVD
jgi:hypothetical protein